MTTGVGQCLVCGDTYDDETHCRCTEERATAGRGVELRDRRKALGFTQRQLADAVGVDFTYICKIERGTAELPPSEALLRRIAAVLDLDAESVIAVSGRTVAVPVSLMLRLRDEVERPETNLWLLWQAAEAVVKVLGPTPPATTVPEGGDG